MRTLSIERGPMYQELDEIAGATRVLGAAHDCFAVQREIAAAAGRDAGRDGDQSAVSPAALQALLERDATVSGVATEPEITTAVPFNNRNVPMALRSARLATLRRRLEREVASWIPEIFAEPERPVLFASGLYWYPPGSHMGWHTNQRFPGWRLYLTHTEEPGRSFFRYRDPDSGRIVTSFDREFHLRLFRVRRVTPLWHSVYADTQRFSVGWIVAPRSPANLVRKLVSGIRARLG